LRDLFAAAFFLAIGLAVEPGALPPVLPAALALAAVTAVTKLLTGAYAASRDKVARRGQLRAGAALIPRGEFSIVILGLRRRRRRSGCPDHRLRLRPRDHRTADRPPHRIPTGIVNAIDIAMFDACRGSRIPVDGQISRFMWVS
jgi:Kef-type K+ transport system membrane component KefB